MVRKAKGRCAVGGLAKVVTFPQDAVGPGRNPSLFAIAVQHRYFKTASGVAYEESYLSLPRSYLYVGMNVILDSE